MNTVTITVIAIIIILLLGTCFLLLMKNINMKESLKKQKNTEQKINYLAILQDFMEVIGDSLITSKEKINKINNLLIEKYEIKYSTVVFFDGTEYKVEASNVGEKHWKTFENLHEQEIFKESAENATPKYITVNKGEKLPYLEMEFERAKSAIFFPMYIDNIYMGYWLIEGNQYHEFDHVDTTILEVIKNNLLLAIRCIKKQRALENLPIYDDVTELNTYEYLYGSARKIIDKYPTSIVSLVKIINLQQIEEKISKKTANAVIKSVAASIKSTLSPEYFLVKYYNNELLIVFSGSDIDGVAKFMEDIKEGIEKLRIKTLGSLNERLNGQTVAPKLNIALTTYFKETALEDVINSLFEYLNEAAPNESDISCL